MDAKVLLYSIAMIIFGLPACYSTVYINASTILDLDGGNLDVSPYSLSRLYCNGTITDTQNNLSFVNASFFHSTLNVNSPNQWGGKYSNTSCNYTRVATNVFRYNCSVDVHFHSRAGTWRCTTGAKSVNNQTRVGTVSRTMNTLLALEVNETNISFGTLAKGTNTGTRDVNITIRSFSNRQIDARVDAYRAIGVPSDTQSFSCATGTIPIGNLRFANTAGVTYTSKTQFTNTPRTTNNNHLPTAFGSDIPSERQLFFGVAIPASGVTGSCNGLMDVVAIAG